MSTFMVTTFKSFSATATALKPSLRQSWGRTVLVASLAVLASACDNNEQEATQSTVATDSSQAKMAPTDKASANADMATTRSIDGSADSEAVAIASVDDDIETGDDGGAGLLEFAEHRQSTPMIAGDAGTSLGATLIGDYSGMLPCAPCEGDKTEEHVMLNLYADGNARKTKQQQASATASEGAAQVGSYQQLDNIISIDFPNTPTEHYLINDNQLIFITDELPDAETTDLIQANPKYVLSRK
jgi:hypothetical protein